MTSSTPAARPVPAPARPTPARVPVSTYRLQISPDLDLFEAARRLTYLRDLGVDWVYLSPLLASEPGSDHGYDVVAHDHVDPERGGEKGLAELSAEARRLGLGILVDIVPNHVGVATPHEDEWWWDVLRLGRDSEHAVAFDIDWAAGEDRITIPVVGDDDVLEDGRIGHLSVIDGELRYHDQRFPLAPGSADDGADADTVHAGQHYELVHWRAADEDLNYRRFFAVNTLAAVRVEDPDVFADSHVEIRRWFTDGLVDGLRVDHPDGLRDPAGYLDDLAELTGGAYVLVEKILEPGEELPASWATQGTTGYDALAWIDRVLTDPAGQRPLDELEAELRGAPVDWAAMVHDRKREVADGILHAEVNRITRELRRVVPEPMDRVADAVAELMACFPVYRSYLPEGHEHLDEAFTLAREHRPDLAETLEMLRPVLSDPAAAPARRLQQTSGMVMAKGVEDCAFYRWSRLTSLNEVGGDPSVFAADPADFHAWQGVRQREWPHAMTTLSTHDTKRGEDVRARITVLAELPDWWATTLRRLLDLAPVPDPGFGNLLWQAVIGAWPGGDDPDLRDRLHGYAEKAMREAGDRTTWTDPDAAYEAAVHAAVDAAFDDPQVAACVDEAVTRLAGPGWSNSLAAKLLALTAPGVPDVYRGSELWEQSLVDPDNRRPVDLDRRERLLSRLADATPRLTEAVDDPGTAKLAVTRAALLLRRDRPDLFVT
ncbi:malto-oligosyltrehalose synthase, partial [Nocardioides sp.]|uniref:malto-oligosyltrehalose synthase n=1 Tax=Nocardioides sp. TaxID=35761 RepID=UPI002735FA5B